MAGVPLPRSQSSAEFEERTNFQRKSPSRFGSIQTYWLPFVLKVPAGRLA